MNLKEYFKHLSIVIFGILIAFGLSNVGAHYKELSTQKQVLLTILNELKDNNENIKAKIQNLDSLSRTIANIQQMKTLPPTDNDTVSFNISYAGLSVKSIGYETAKYTGILKDINYTLVSEIVENYEVQNTLKELEKIMTDEFFVLIKNGIDKETNFDYLLLHISNLKGNLESVDVEQRQLIENLSAKVLRNDDDYKKVNG